MRTLILLRHAKAETAAPSQSDESRALTGRGRRQAAEAGAALAAEGYKPGLVLVSTSTRTRETAAGAFAQDDAPLRFEAGLYHAAPRALWTAFQSSDANEVAIVAHNPGLSELVSYLIRDARDHSAAARAASEGLPTSAWAALEIRGETFEAPGARLLNFWRPARD